MFVAWRDLRFARGRFALIIAVVVLITLLVGLLSGLMSGLQNQNISAIAGLPAERPARPVQRRDQVLGEQLRPALPGRAAVGRPAVEHEDREPGLERRHRRQQQLLRQPALRRGPLSGPRGRYSIARIMLRTTG